MTIDRAIRVLDVYASVNGSGQCTQEEFEEAKKMAIEALKGKDTNAPSRKGVFIPGITVEMFRNASLIGVEDLMASGEMEDISLPPAQPELTDGQAIEHLQKSGWMQNHDKQMYEMGLREQLADDSDSYDALLPSAQPELARINDCNGCKFIGCYDTDFPCANCVRKDKDYYEPEG